MNSPATATRAHLGAEEKEIPATIVSSSSFQSQNLPANLELRLLNRTRCG